MSMAISGTSNYVAPAALTQSVQSPPANSASDPGGEGGGRVHKSRGGGGQMHNAMMQALQSLGLSMAQQTTGATSANPTLGSTDSDGDSDGSASTTSSVKNDMRQLMHALFQAVKGETASGTSGTGSNPANPKANFAAGLSALISQVSSGTAPADLQSAFAKVATDLQPTNATSTSSSTSTGANATAANPQATLQALLTQLQQNLGYGNSSSSAAIGSFLSTRA